MPAHKLLCPIWLALPVFMNPQLSAQASKVADVPNLHPKPLSVSPDGRFLAEIRNMGNLAIRSMETGETTQMTRSQYPQAVSAAVFSPDGELISYAWQNEEGYVDLRVVAVSGSDPRVLFRDPDVRYLSPKAWSPDGQHLVIVALRADSTGHIALVSASDGSFEVLLSLDVRPRLQLVSSPAWGESPKTIAFSPDSRFIAYDVSARGNDPNHDIHVLAVEASSQNILVHHPADDRLLGWTPDGRGIVFASDRTGSVDLWRLPVVEGELDGAPEALISDVGPIDPLTHTRSGSYYYLARRGRCSLYLIDLDSDSVDQQYAPQLIGPAFHTSGVDWSPDGKRLAYITPAGGVSPSAWTVAVRSLETGEVRTLPQDADILHRFHPQWSPDGASLLAHGWDPQAPPGGLVYAIDVETGTQKTITSTPSQWERQIDWVGWAGDGQAVTYLNPPGFSGTARVFRFQPESEEETELLARTVPPYIYAYNTSPNGRNMALGLYNPTDDTSTLEIVSITGDSRKLPGVWDTPVWYRDSRRFLYFAAHDLWLTSVDGEQPMHLGTIELPAGIEIQTGSIHPDGRRLAFIAQEPFHYEVWVLRGVDR
jgi:Tol biopolymer transport system component